MSDALVDVARHSEERVGPSFLMPSRQPGVAAGISRHERRIFREDAVPFMTTTDPQFILLLLPPRHRGRLAANLESEVVFMPGADLSDGEVACGSVVESQ